MKALRLLFFVILGFGMGACALTENSIEDVGTQLEQGLQGRGRIVPNNPTSDSFGPEYQ